MLNILILLIRRLGIVYYYPHFRINSFFISINTVLMIYFNFVEVLILYVRAFLKQSTRIDQVECFIKSQRYPCFRDTLIIFKFITFYTFYYTSYTVVRRIFIAMIITKFYELLIYLV